MCSMYRLGGGLLWPWLGLCPGLGWACAGLYLLVLGLRPVAGPGSGFCRAGVGLGGVVGGAWWAGLIYLFSEVFPGLCMACLPTSFLTLCWPMLCLPFYLFCLLRGYSLAYHGLSPGYPMAGACPCSLPLFRATAWACSRPTAGPCPGLCTVLHPLLLGLRPVTCPAPGSCASGYQYSYPLVSISIGSVWYLLDSITLVPCLSPCLSDYHQCTGVPPRSSVPVCEGTLIHPRAVPQSHATPQGWARSLAS